MEEDIKKEFNKLDKNFKLAEFDTIYTSFLILIIGSLIAIIISYGNTNSIIKGVSIGAMGILLISFLFQFISLFLKNKQKIKFKKYSFNILALTILTIIVDVIIFNKINIYIRNIILAILVTFAIAYFWFFNKYFNDLRN
jgi:xanthine/uracil permease